MNHFKRSWKFMIILVLCLALASVISLILSHYLPFQDFLVNLATELIGILITVVFVNWILEKKQKEQWESVDSRVSDRLMTLINKIIGGIRTSFGIKIDVLLLDEIDPDDSISIHKEVLRVANEVISPSIRTGINNLNQQKWKYFYQHLSESQKEISYFINIFQSRLSPIQLSILLDIQDYLSLSRTFYEVFPDIAGIAEENLPEPIHKSSQLKFNGYEATADNLQTVIALINDLSNTLCCDS